MKQISINGLRFSYEKERNLFNGLLKVNGVSKKKFCEKFGLSYSYVNAWGSKTSQKEVKFPSWVFQYLKDVMYYKIEAVKIKLPLERIYERLVAGENLTDIYKSQNTIYSEDIMDELFIPQDLIEKKASFVIEL